MKNKMAIIGHNAPSALSRRLVQLMDESAMEIEIISPEQASELSRQPIAIPLMPMAVCDMPFSPPMTRAQRRALNRKNKK